MRRSRRLPILLGLAFLAVALATGSAGAGAPGRASARVLRAQVSTCAELSTASRTVAQDLTGLNPPGTLGNPELCLMYTATEDVYTGVVISVDDATQFDGAKSDAITQLPGLGVDLCKIANWQAQGAQPVSLSADQQLNLPIECTPRIKAADPGAATLLPAVQASFVQVVDVTGTQTGWRPIRPLIVKVFTDVNVAIPAINQYMLPNLPGETADSLSQRTRDGASWQKGNDPSLGSLILLNLTRSGARTQGGIQFAVAFTYTSYAHNGISGNGNIYIWFRQGLDSFQAERNGGSARGYLAIAVQGQKQGTETTPLSDLTTLERFFAHQRAEGAAPVQARVHAAFVYLVEQYGFGAMIQLLQQSHDAPRSSFESLLAGLTGLDQPGLDQAFAAWLSATSTSGGRGGADFHVAATVAPGSTYAEITVTFDRNLTCGSSHVAQGANLTFQALVPAGGPVTVTGLSGDATVTVQLTMGAGMTSGTMRYVNPAIGCDTGPLPFVG